MRDKNKKSLKKKKIEINKINKKAIYKEFLSRTSI